ncbi:MAG: hypothetical protein PHE63_12220 [Eubacteriales bacterium]|nr:hypothetical protein [Eubacteriales bacterium]
MSDNERKYVKKHVNPNSIIDNSKSYRKNKRIVSKSRFYVSSSVILLAIFLVIVTFTGSFAVSLGLRFGSHHDANALRKAEEIQSQTIEPSSEMLTTKTAIITRNCARKPKPSLLGFSRGMNGACAAKYVVVRMTQ